MYKLNPYLKDFWRTRKPYKLLLFLLFVHLQYSMTACLQDKAPNVAWISFLFSLLPSAYAR